MTTTMPQSAGPAAVAPSNDSLPLHADDVIQFPAGIPGFELCQRFVLLAMDGLMPLRCLQSVEGPPASFLVVDPGLLAPGYSVPLSSADRARLGAAPEDPILWLVIVTIDAEERAFANLRAPLVINPAAMRGCQIVSAEARYPLRSPLVTAGD